eukprot:31142-Pelagococcus_subviridis.AAC.3
MRTRDDDARARGESGRRCRRTDGRSRGGRRRLTDCRGRTADRNFANKDPSTTNPVVALARCPHRFRASVGDRLSTTFFTLPFSPAAPLAPWVKNQIFTGCQNLKISPPPMSAREWKNRSSLGRDP